MFKRAIILLTFVFFAVFLVSCEPSGVEISDKNLLMQIAEEIELTGEVSDNFSLPNTFENPDITVTWSSNNAAIIILAGNQAIVSRGNEDITVTLTALLKLNDETYEHEFNVIVKAQESVGTVTVEFTVYLPEGTPMDKDVYIAGDFGAGSGMPQWDPKSELGKATRIDETTATFTLVYDNLYEDITISYKWTLGSWETVEKTESGDELQDRTEYITNISSHVYIENIVERWADSDQTPGGGDQGDPNSDLFTEFEWTLVVNLPSYTPENDDIYILGNFPENTGLSQWGEGATNPLNKLERHGNTARITILFTELNENVILKFKVTRGGYETVEGDENRAYIEDREYIITRKIAEHTFEITVLSWEDIDPSLTDENKLAAAVSDLTINQNIYDELTLPFEGLYGALISWTSDNEAIVIEDGLVTVTRIETDVDVTLTATITLGSLSETKAFNVIVKSADIEVQTITVEFTVTLPAGTPMDEDIYIAGDFSLSGFSQWAPDDPLGKATRVDETTATLTLVYEGLEEDITIFYKWTLGSWDSVERSIDNKNIDNRSVVIDHTLSSMIIEDSVARWANILGPTEPGPYTEFEWTLIVHLPDNTPIHDDIYIFGLFPENSGLSEWGGADNPLNKLTREGNIATTTILFTELNDKFDMYFKITRGNWEKVETDQNGYDILNRHYGISREIQSHTFEITVASWKDLYGQPLQNSVVGNLDILADFNMPQYGEEVFRTIRVWTPESYDPSGTITYPVIYMHDGQNLFDSSTSFAGEWSVDETIMQLIDEGYFDGVIVVGIDNAGANRLDEYTPNWTDIENADDLYTKFIVETLKPYIDANYLTKPEREHTMVAGSSLGGLISFHIGLSNPDVFGTIIAFSTSFEIHTDTARADFLDTINLDGNLPTIILDAGSEESLATYVPVVVSELEVLGYPEDAILSRVVEGHSHNESAWRIRFKDALISLFDEPSI